MSRLSSISRLTVRLLFIYSLCLNASVFSQSEEPSWRDVRNVLTNDSAVDFAVVNQGQVKNIAKQAFLEMEAKTPGGAGATLRALMGSWGALGPRGEYYSNLNFSGSPTLVRNEGVDFDWASGSPALGLSEENFSVRWSGDLLPPSTGNYIIEIRGARGVRVLLNGQIIFCRRE